MKKRLFALAVGLAFLLLRCQTEAPKTAAAEAADPVKHGAYLVQTMGCNDCHSPKKMGAQGPEVIAETLLSGYPADRPTVKFEHELLKNGFSLFYPDLAATVGPWGTSFAANLTPDDSGLGNWSFEQFKKAMTEGRAKGLENGRMLLPPMPWQNYSGMKDEDLKAIFAYLKSIPPVRNIVPPPVAPI